ncbi:Bifunctional purine biosynthesis protein PurH [Candidatus Kinetoplastibacterium sorsogonicusi]|uniref:Bifunctional purine biosynthesis protein PurH n=1 Tax=Candidatus Kinetoplastidibacterium kentomonadis TaxID=1576550 RepID=A0A3S7JAD2_9PROT|nr:bifunctional phosphoribosylaminoimidazolecarboxamide formyltransferase/IMP cyclohydrolase [Candidatus Kinetoplastibacterium sorsogonicusi]AWD32628.1 Bifunctional purine biosynthesis protein PurH [Candidatus Kinetoplastibacterium sorsogonicusi]
MNIKTALLSVSDKTGIVKFAKTLESQNIILLSTGGTSSLLKSHGIKFLDVSEYTKSPEILDGRVKTLHPKIHAGILAKRNDKNHLDLLKSNEILPIDLVVVNLYPFESTIASDNCKLSDAIENMDIGGPTMIRAAAKNHGDSINPGVTVVTDINDYQDIQDEILKNGFISYKKRLQLSIKAFALTAKYDGKIAEFLSSLNMDDEIALLENTISKKKWPDVLTMQFFKKQDLRYGENSHQSASFYINNYNNATISNAIQLQGKELSYNNLADANAAFECLLEFNDPACVIVKHNNPCGVAISNNIKNSYQKAFSTDPISAFGGIIAFNRIVDLDTVELIFSQFIEVLIAPDYTQEAIEKLSFKKNIRVLKTSNNIKPELINFKKISGGLLIQDYDNSQISKSSMKVVTKKHPSDQEIEDMIFASKVAKHVKSNAIVFAKNGMTLGIGAGQMSRVDSVKIATIKANNVGLKLENSIAASDAFFPFRDGIDQIVAAGIKCIIQPGGSIHDEDIILAANEHNITMVISGIRNFCH